MDQSVEEINEQGSFQLPDRDDVNWRCRSRSPETTSSRESMMLLIGDTGMMVILTD